MFFWIIKQMVISLVIIILVHYLFVFFKTNLTVPKIKDLVNRPDKNYKEIYSTMQAQNPRAPLSQPKYDSTKISQLPTKKEKGDKMKLELKNYLKGLEQNRVPIGEALPVANFDIFKNNFEEL